MNRTTGQPPRLEAPTSARQIEMANHLADVYGLSFATACEVVGYVIDTLAQPGREVQP